MRVLAILSMLAAVGCVSRPVNPGAEIEVYQCADMPPHAVAYTSIDDERVTLFFSDAMTTWSFRPVHEYEHVIEHALRYDPDARRIVRHCFRSLCAPGFEIGHDDLMEELP